MGPINLEVKMIQGPLKIWMEHFNQSHFLKLQRRRDYVKTPGAWSTLWMDFLDYELYDLKNVHIKVFLIELLKYGNFLTNY